MNQAGKHTDNKQETFRDHLATVDQSGKRIWLFPRKPEGKYYNARTIVSVVLLALLFGLPFIKYKGHPLFLFNIIDRKFILFGQIFWPQDFFIFGLGMVVFVIFVALFTVVFGRLFCGWVCPQTIFMEMVFRKIEYWIEGDRGAQIALKKAPWNTDKLIKKISKWLIFWVISFLIANTFLSYIIGVDELKKIITGNLSDHLGGFAGIVVFTTVFFGVFSWMREQVCTTVCPYGRMQGVLLDRDSIIVTYDHVRGEPRGKFKKNEERHNGDCIDCHQCVDVCPTGIDIRNGTQLECVNCTACIDVCNKMMDAVGLPRNLIRYDSESSVAENKKFRFTGRMKAYTAVMILLLGVLTYLLASRTDVGVTILRTSGQLFQERPNNEISNLYNFKMLNKTYLPKTLELKLEGNMRGRIEFVGHKQLNVPQEGYLSGNMFIFLDKAEVKHRKQEITISVYESGKKIKTIKTNFLGPFSAG